MNIKNYFFLIFNACNYDFKIIIIKINLYIKFYLFGLIG